MRRTVLIASALVVAACGGAGPTDAGGSDGSTPDGGTTPPTATTEPLDLTPLDCADEPDPTLYPEGEVPAVVAPCSVPEELVVHTIRTGTGEPAEDGDQLIVDYLGMVVGSGEVFDTSYNRDIPFDFQLGRGGVIPGWDQALVGATAGSLLRLDIPNDLAYGDSPPGEKIQPGDALSFYVEVRAVIAAVTPDEAPLDLEIEPSVGATELVVTDLVVGGGAVAEAGSTVVVHLLLVRGDNEVVLFDTWANNDPFQIMLEEGQSLPGVIEGLEGATVGTLRLLTIPPDLAFGPDGETSLGLPAGTDLIVVAKIVGVY